jgi:pimeloyl-ACP methyl ester carboxylesterase
MKKLFLAVTLSYVSILWAQTSTRFDYKNPSNSNEPSIQLEAYVYEPSNPNGKTILFSHGSTGGKKELISYSTKFPTIASEVTKQGYRLVVYMRKGRGKSEGVFVEETGKCDRGSLDWEVADAYPQINQVVDQIRDRYKADKVILMGHSRGGFLSSLYAANNPSKVIAAVNLAGVWSAFCESRNNGYSHDALKESATKFKNQYWVYFENDSYFSEKRFNDPKYIWISETAKNNGLIVGIYPDAGEADGHATAYKRPDLWSGDVFKWLNQLK